MYWEIGILALENILVLQQEIFPQVELKEMDELNLIISHKHKCFLFPDLWCEGDKMVKLQLHPQHQWV